MTKVMAASGPCSRDTVRARNDRTPAIMPRIFLRERPMTAYLISLALIGLIAIAIWEEPS
ncbi:hypothetical protein [Bradyrhizobium sp. JYMT SZCCT0428]|uniref:hypothetical protein n=1 Tax=Bradyrhizobium sp. JYMT SZCCT0428 TaxID=2807673 RepID=UPI001BA5C20C|nr:hypothetical protein [Bradyrhizobium sp. JYMT SZCCT0428]MBR1152715.1 hypothetical protein [Bradyrhizobium sp. JYMT SZCCT0428]